MNSPTPPQRSPIHSTSVGIGQPTDQETPGQLPERTIRMIWMGSLLGSSARTAAFARRVDRDLLPALLREWAPRISLHGRGWTDHSDQGDVVCEFREFRDFRPERILERVPMLKGLAAVRSLIQELRNEPIDLSMLAPRLVGAGADPDWVRDLEQRLAHHTHGSADTAVRRELDRAPVKSDGVAGILGLADLPTTSIKPAQKPDGASDPLTNLLERLGGQTGRKRHLEREIASELLLEIDSALGAQLASILHHSDFVRLETAWRALKFLVERTDFKKGVFLEVVSATKDDLPHAMEGLVEREQETGGLPPLVAIWMDFEFDATVRDMESLARIGELASGQNVPVLAAVGPTFFGVSGMRELNHMSPFWDHFKRPEFIPFAGLRKAPGAGSIALALPRFLARAPYGKGSPVHGLAWDESAHESWREARWTRPVAAIASAVTSSHARTGWPTAFTDPIEGRILDLPIDTVEGNAGVMIMSPLDTELSDSTVGELEQSGFTVLTAPRNSDSARVARAPMLSSSVPVSHLEPRQELEPDDSLSYQILAAFVAGVIHRLMAGVTISDPETISESLCAGLVSQLALERDRVHVETTPVERGTRFDIHLRLPVPSETGMDLAIEVAR